MSKSPIWERLSSPKDKGEEWRAEKRKEYAAEGMKRFASPSNGYFGTPQSLAVGSPYKDPEYALKHPRGGAQFHSLGSGRGNASPDGALSKAPSIHVGDEYVAECHATPNVLENKVGGSLDVIGISVKL